MSLTGRIEALFAAHGHVPYEGARREPISALEHALQCAQLAEWAQATDALVAAALLHDVGHFLAAEAIAQADAFDDRHEHLAIPFLAAAFGAAVTAPVRLHVDAKRYLVQVDPLYVAQLSPASRHSLGLQGGPMDADEARRFAALPHALDAVQLRRWDDQAKQPGRPTPPLAYYLALLDDLQARPALESRVGIGAIDIS
jgi:phosphonate degradation associated HDIG domain protein